MAMHTSGLVNAHAVGEGHMLIRAPCGSVKGLIIIHVHFHVQFCKNTERL